MIYHDIPMIYPWYQLSDYPHGSYEIPLESGHSKADASYRDSTKLSLRCSQVEILAWAEAEAQWIGLGKTYMDKWIVGITYPSSRVYILFF